MMKLKKHTCILFLSLMAVFLFGCSKECEQKSTPDAPSKEPCKETAVKQAQQTQEAAVSQVVSSENSEVEQKLAFAQSNLKMAQKGILSYSQTVAICRDVIKEYPETEYQQQAQMLLREVPEDLRSQYNLSDEELGF